jgi:hypothetical protein
MVTVGQQWVKQARTTLCYFLVITPYPVKCNPFSYLFRCIGGQLLYLRTWKNGNGLEKNRNQFYMPTTFYVILVNLYHGLTYGLHTDWIFALDTRLLDSNNCITFCDSCVSNVYCNDLIFMISFCNVTMHTSLGLCLVILSLFSATQWMMLLKQ